MPTFLHLPFELQSSILQSAFLDALDADLSSHPVRPLSSCPAYHPTIQRSEILLLSPMHKTTSMHDLVTQLLPLIISPSVSDNNSEADNDSVGGGEMDYMIEDDLTISPNQLIHCLCRSKNLLMTDSEATKSQMRNIVLGQPWARVASDAYCTLWRRKERAEIVGDVIEAALRICKSLEGGELDVEEGGIVIV